MRFSSCTDVEVTIARATRRSSASVAAPLGAATARVVATGTIFLVVAGAFFVVVVLVGAMCVLRADDMARGGGIQPPGGQILDC